MRKFVALVVLLVLVLAAGRLPAQEPVAYAAADAHADRAPAAVTTSVASLAAYLARAGNDELTKTRALFRWITSNIDYDGEGFRTGSYGDLSPDGVLRRRVAVCQGYAGLLEAVGTAMGLRIVVVPGWSKGYGYRPGQALAAQTDHAWNAVQVGGRWHLMDPTWGAGSLDNQFRFTRRFQPHYFLTDPAAFIYDHLPQDPQWQLLERPVTAAQYAEMAYLRPGFFSAGLATLSHAGARIEAGDALAVTFGAARPAELSAQLIDVAANRVLERGLTFIETKEREVVARAVFPRPGQYLLRLFAKPRGAEGQAVWAVDYTVDASRGAGDTAGFPETYGSYTSRGVTLGGPLGGTLQAGQAYRFRLTAPGAIDVAIVANGQWTHFTKAGDEFTAELTAVPGAIVVYAKYPGDDQFTGLLRYTGR